LLDKALQLSQFLLNELSSRVDRGTAEGRARLLQEAKPLVKAIAAPMLSLLLRKSLAQLTGVSQQELDAEFQIRSLARPAPAAARRQSAVSQPMRLLTCLLGNLALCHKISDEQAALLAASPEYAPVLEVIRYAQQAEPGSVAACLEAMRDTPYETLFQDAAARILHESVDANAAEHDIHSILRSVEESRVKAEFEQLTRQPMRTEADIARFRMLEQQLKALKGAPPG
jgi:DNA primase